MDRVPPPPPPPKQTEPKKQSTWFWFFITLIILSLLGGFIYYIVLPKIMDNNVTTTTPQPQQQTTTVSPDEEPTVEPQEKTAIQKMLPDQLPTPQARPTTITLQDNTYTDGKNKLTINNMELKLNNCTTTKITDYCITGYNIEPTNDPNNNEPQNTTPTEIYYFQDIINTRIFNKSEKIEKIELNGEYLEALQTKITHTNGTPKTIIIIVNKDATGWLVTTDNQDNDIINEIKKQIIVNN